MERYKLLNKKVFESRTKFEERLNAMVLEGWKPISVAADQGSLTVLLEKNR